MVAARPLRVLGGLDLVPEAHGVGPAGPARGVTVHMVPAPVLQGDGEDYMIEWSRVSRLASGSIFCGSLAPVPIT